MKRTLLVGANLTDARMTNADISGADLSSAILSKGSLTFARVDCDTRLPNDFDAAAEPVIPMARCPGSKPIIIDGTEADRRHLSPTLTDAFLDGAAISNLFGRFIRTSLDRARFTGRNRLSFTEVNARDSRFENVEGYLDIVGSDLTGASIIGSSEKPIKIRISRAAYGTTRSTKLDNASLANVDLQFGFSPEDRFKESRISIAGLKLRDARLSCSDDARYWGTVRNLVADLALVRDLAALDPSNTIVPECAKVVETYLGASCKAGIDKAGFAYTCPAAAVAPK
jgi:uncharacterized protein YjbI with pentapeptide repeats